MENLALTGLHMLIQVGMKGRKEEEREGRGERGGPGRILPDSLGSETAVVCFWLHGKPGFYGVAHVDLGGNERQEGRGEEDQAGHSGVVWAQRQQLCSFGSMEKLGLALATGFSSCLVDGVGPCDGVFGVPRDGVLGTRFSDFLVRVGPCDGRCGVRCDALATGFSACLVTGLALATGFSY